MLGPLQKKWVEALKSGDFKQGKAVLLRDDRYCCLGVACEVVGEKNIVNKTLLPLTVEEKFRFRNEMGVLKHSKESRKGFAYFNLAIANDAGETFQAIAEFVEKFPEVVFTGEV